ncbi:MAG TPA: SDR family oxidoreductase [Alphaproteobacteria bacterium]|nr:SDR family oxidoreductase [Alphaproteobacteria bacterium]
MRGLNSKRVIITGGASGIGRAICARLGEEGCRVGILDLDGDGAEKVANAIRESGGHSQALPCDISDYDAVKTAISKIEKDAGPSDILVNNAGWDKAARFLDTEPAFWEKVINVNYIGPLNMCHIMASGMAERGSGKVINISSDAGRVGSSGEAVYAGCKGAVIAFGKTLARELARRGVTVNTICPGPTDTPLLRGVDPTGKLQDALKRAIPMRRLGEPEDYPGTVAFLASQDADYITGQVISVSGGLTMHG